MVVLFLAAGAFDVFTGEEPRLSVQIDTFPFGLQQLANPAQRTQADPKRELSLLLGTTWIHSRLQFEGMMKNVAIAKKPGMWPGSL
jgi:hypothetical protein